MFEIVIGMLTLATAVMQVLKAVVELRKEWTKEKRRGAKGKMRSRSRKR